jgi:hypothetical protein
MGQDVPHSVLDNPCCLLVMYVLVSTGISKRNELAVAYVWLRHATNVARASPLSVLLSALLSSHWVL